jgi:hypothetical protein
MNDTEMNIRTKNVRRRYQHSSVGVVIGTAQGSIPGRHGRQALRKATTYTQNNPNKE